MVRAIDTFVNVNMGSVERPPWHHQQRRSLHPQPGEQARGGDDVRGQRAPTSIIDTRGPQAGQFTASAGRPGPFSWPTRSGNDEPKIDGSSYA